MEGLIILAIILIWGMYYNSRYGGPMRPNMINQYLGIENNNWKLFWLGSSAFIILGVIIIYLLEPK